MDVLETLGSNSVEDYMLALVVFVSAALFFRVFKYLIVKSLKSMSSKTRTDFDDFIIKIIDSVGWQLYLLLSLHIALQFMEVPVFIGSMLYYVLFIVAIYYIVKAVHDLFDFSVHMLIKQRKTKKGDVDSSVLHLLNKILKIVLWFVAFILILSNLGFDVSALVAGLGVGGIAIAFALQAILGDIFASFSIHFDKPFNEGDFIMVGDDMGVVKRIGIKSTRIQTLKGEELVVSNTELTQIRVHNYGKMEKRRSVFNFGVTYATSTPKLRMIPDIVAEVVGGIDLADLDRVHFKSFGDFSLVFEVVYYVLSSDYLKYMDIQHELNLGIKELFEREGIEMAYPTQTVYVSNAG